jgi:hypothetical protein
LTISFCNAQTTITISGHVWHDANGNLDNLVNNTYTLPNIINSVTCPNGPTTPIPTGLKVVLVKASTYLV